MAKNPTKGEIVLAKETAPDAKDDILGKYRDSLIATVNAAIRWHSGNVPSLSSNTFYKAYVFDPMNTTPGGGAVAPNAPGNFGLATEVPSLTGAFAGPVVDLPNAGQVPQNAGELVEGQTVFYEIDQSNYPNSVVNTSDPNSVAHTIALYTSIMSRVRAVELMHRDAVTNHRVSAKSRGFPRWHPPDGTQKGGFTGPYPVKINGVQVTPGDLATFTELYSYVVGGTKKDIGHLAEPFRAAPLYITILNTVFEDPINRPSLLPSTTPAIPAAIIRADKLIEVFERMRGVWEEAKQVPANIVVDFCHSSCHASCHNSRNRR